jgi:acyl-CoA thioesterase
MSDADTLARKVAATMLAQEGAGPAWGVEIEEAREGYARVAMVMRADMLNGHGAAHGGMTFALADSAFAYACNSRNQATVAQHASISFLASVREGDRLVAEAVERALTGRTGVYDVVVQVGDTTVAVFQGLSRTIGGPVIAGEPQA